MYERTDASVQTNAARPARAHGRTDARPYSTDAHTDARARARARGPTGAHTHMPIRDFAAAIQ